MGRRLVRNWTRRTISCLFLCRKLHLFLGKSTKTAATRAALFDSNMHQIVCRRLWPKPHIRRQNHVQKAHPWDVNPLINQSIKALIHVDKPQGDKVKRIYICKKINFKKLKSPRKDFYLPKLCRLRCTLITGFPPKIPFPWAVFLGARKTPTQKFGNFTRVYTPARGFTYVFQTWSKSVQDRSPKNHLSW